jgi:hypothetical protein
MGTRHQLGTITVQGEAASFATAPPKRFVTLHPLYQFYSLELRRRALSRLTQEMKEGRVWPTEDEKLRFHLIG